MKMRPRMQLIISLPNKVCPESNTLHCADSYSTLFLSHSIYIFISACAEQAKFNLVTSGRINASAKNEPRAADFLIQNKLIMRRLSELDHHAILSHALRLINHTHQTNFALAQKIVFGGSVVLGGTSAARFSFFLLFLPLENRFEKVI
jgi:hypothetical protein